jgi:hypothetical protein
MIPPVSLRDPPIVVAHDAGAAPSVDDAGAASARDPSAPPSFAGLLRGLGREVDHGESTLRKALASPRSAANLGPAELIALQAGVYRYSEAIDLTSRLVDRATSAVRTVVQGNGT